MEPCCMIVGAALAAKGLKKLFGRNKESSTKATEDKFKCRAYDHPILSDLPQIRHIEICKNDK